MGVFADFWKSFLFMQGPFGETSLMAPSLELSTPPPPRRVPKRGGATGGAAGVVVGVRG
jgi:hypothetical protein